jgi:hypothetical protein
MRTGICSLKTKAGGLDPLLRKPRHLQPLQRCSTAGPPPVALAAVAGRCWQPAAMQHRPAPPRSLDPASRTRVRVQSGLGLQIWTLLSKAHRWHVTQDGQQLRHHEVQLEPTQSARVTTSLPVDAPALLTVFGWSHAVLVFGASGLQALKQRVKERLVRRAGSGMVATRTSCNVK